MRNLKKVLAVIVAIAIMATAMVPAFAAASYTYTAEATTLNQLGLYSGTSTGSFNPDLGAKLTREAGIVLLLGTFGLKAEADKMSAADVDSILDKYTDKATISSWAKTSVAYAIKNGISTGTSATTWAPKASMPGKDLAKWIGNQLGYSDKVAYASAVEDLQKLDGNTLTSDEAKAFDAKSAAIRDDVVGIIYGVLTVKTKDATKTLIETLVGDNADLKQIAQEAGLVAKTPDAATAISSVKATGAKILTVTLDGPVADTTKVTATVKKASYGVNIADAKWSDDKTSVAITLSTKLAADDYTVTLKGVTSADLTGKVTATDEKIAKINFPSTTAVLRRDNNDGTSSGKALFAPIEVFNQYDENVTSSLPSSSNITITASKGEATLNGDDGVVDINYTGTSPFEKDDKLSVSAIDSDTGSFASATLTVGDAGKVGSIEISKITNPSDSTAVLDTGSDYGNFVLVTSMKDQYGNTVLADDAALVQEDVAVTTSDSSIATFEKTTDGKDPYFRSTPIDGTKYITLKLAEPSSKKAGTATITMLSKTTGKMAKFDVVIKDTSKVETLSLSQPDVVAADEDLIIPFTAVDEFGNAVTDNDGFEDVTWSTSVYVADKGNGGAYDSKNPTAGSPTNILTKSPETYQDYVAGVPKLKIRIPVANVDDKITLSATWTTSSGNTKNTSTILSVKDKAVPTVITGYTTDVNLNYETGGSEGLEADFLKAQDQYGRDIAFGDDWMAEETDTPASMTAAQLKYKYYVYVKTDDTNTVSLFNGNGVASSDSSSTYVLTKDEEKVTITGNNKGSTTLTFKLKYADGSTSSSANAPDDVDKDGFVKNSDYTYTSRVVEKDDIASYAVNDISKLYDGTSGWGTTVALDDSYMKDFKVTGTLKDGKKVTVPEKYYSVASGDSHIKYNNYKIWVSADGIDYGTNDAGGAKHSKDFTAVVAVTAKGGTVTISKNYTASDDGPSSEKVFVVDGDKSDKESDNIVSVTLSDLKVFDGNATDISMNDAYGLIADAVEVDDQYGNELTMFAPTHITVGLTDVQKVYDTVSVTNIEDKDGNEVSSIAGLTYGGTFTVTVTTGGKYLTFKVVIK